MPKPKLPTGKLSQDIAWTIGSFVILALSGISINIIIAALRGPAELGVFNQTFSVYLVASQVAALGIHYSVLRNSAYIDNDATERAKMLNAALLLASILGTTCSVATWFLAPALSAWFDSPATEASVRFAAVGLATFSVNKILISYLNGLRRMRMFSILQATRYLSITAWVTYVSASGRPFEEAALCFLTGEAATVTIGVLYFTRHRLFRIAPVSSEWLWKHLQFGSKSILAGMFVELNSRIDVLLIGAFMSDKDVGIYSFAAMLIDGVYNLLTMIRVNLNPVLVSAVKVGDWKLAKSYLTRTKKILFASTFLVSSVILICFHLGVDLLFPGKSFGEGIIPLTILLLGLTFVSAFIPFDNLLLISGFPGFQTAQHLAVVIFNTLFNLALIPALGLAGAALATAMSYLVGIAALVWLVQAKLGWNLLTNTTKNEAATK